MAVSVRVSGDVVAWDDVLAEGVRLALSAAGAVVSPAEVASGPVVELVALDPGELFALLGWPRPDGPVRVVVRADDVGAGTGAWVSAVARDWGGEVGVKLYFGLVGPIVVDYYVRVLRVSYLALRREVTRLGADGEAPDRYVFVVPEGSALTARDAARCVGASDWVAVQDSGRRRRQIDAGLWAELCEPDAGEARPILERWAVASGAVGEGVSS